jgi:signal-transduction protein with cAMP-binding, CBS, and nucleotidyltransferase domain
MILVERLLAAARRRLTTIADDAPVIDAAQLLRKGTDLVVVCERSGRMAGILTKTDVVAQVSRCEGSNCVTPLSSVMTRNVVFCRPEDSSADVWSKMKPLELKNIPIVDVHSHPVGLLNARDVLQVLLQETEYEEALLRDYVMCVSYH